MQVCSSKTPSQSATVTSRRSLSCKPLQQVGLNMLCVWSCHFSVACRHLKRYLQLLEVPKVAQGPLALLLLRLLSRCGLQGIFSYETCCFGALASFKVNTRHQQ